MSTLLDRIRRPATTGDDRCWPCTVANGVVLSLAVGLLAITGRRVAAALVALGGAAAIGLRGYLVPYTPRFAPRLVAALSLPVDPFDHGDERGRGSLSDAGVAAAGAGNGDGTGSETGDRDESRPAETETEPPSGEAVVTALIEAGAVVPAGDDLVLDNSFRTEWRREMMRLRGCDLDELAAAADELTESSIDARVGRNWRGRASTVRLEGEGPAGRTASLGEAVAVAELAAARALESRIDNPAVRIAAGQPLRSLLAECPLCDGDLTVTRSTCCGEVTPISSTPPAKLACPDCDVRLFTYD